MTRGPLFADDAEEPDVTQIPAPPDPARGPADDAAESELAAARGERARNGSGRSAGLTDAMGATGVPRRTPGQEQPGRPRSSGRPGASVPGRPHVGQDPSARLR